MGSVVGAAVGVVHHDLPAEGVVVGVVVGVVLLDLMVLGTLEHTP